MQIRKLIKEEYPTQLFEIPQPPENLWVIGNIPNEKNLVYLSVVGSRKFTSYGKEVCEKIIEGLKGYPIVIVSGFAMGIDTIAHKKAMQVGLKTVVFPGSGLGDEVIYPRTNIPLIKEILKNDGCLISEFEPNFRATPWSFPMRNRLMAGISRAVLIIEAEEKSGTLITARLATEYNRDVLAVPGSIFSQNAKGTNRLIQQGATPVTSSIDVLSALGFDTLSSVDENIQKKLFEDLSPEEKKVIALLHEPILRDDLLREMKMLTSQANSILSIMEIKGLIKEEYGEIKLI